jgi:hypothetical protein
MLGDDQGLAIQRNLIEQFQALSLEFPRWN